MKYLIYQINNRVNAGTEDAPRWVDNLFQKTMIYTEANEEIVKKEAYNGKYTVEDDGNGPTAPRNIVAGEYVTADGVLYLATANIPNGESIIVGQNAVETTLEEQLYALTKGE